MPIVGRWMLRLDSSVLVSTSPAVDMVCVTAVWTSGLGNKRGLLLHMVELR